MKNEIIIEEDDEAIAREAVIKREKEIDKIIKNFPRSKSNLSYLKQREIALKLMNKNSKDVIIKESLDLQNNKIKLINIQKIEESKEDYIKLKKEEIEDRFTDYEKLLKVLNDLNSSEDVEIKLMPSSKEMDLSIEESKGSINIQNILYQSSISDTTMDTSQSQHYYDFRDEKVKFWIKNEYYDETENKDIIKKFEGIQKISLRDKDKKEYYSYIYDDNNLRTYFFTISKKLSQYKNPIREEKDINYKNEYGLIFCGKTIDKYNKKCNPDNMMCNECMEKNLKLYGYNKKHFLININGRICFDNFKGGNGKYHCIGKFLVNKEIKNCLPGEFSCKACNILDGIKDYYNKK